MSVALTTSKGASAAIAKGKNTAAIYEAVLHLTQDSGTVVLIEANSPEEAREKAGKINPNDIHDWMPYGGQVVVEAVKPAKRGGFMDSHLGVCPATVQPKSVK